MRLFVAEQSLSFADKHSLIAYDVSALIITLSVSVIISRIRISSAQPVIFHCKSLYIYCCTSIGYSYSFCIVAVFLLLLQLFLYFYRWSFFFLIVVQTVIAQANIRENSI